MRKEHPQLSALYEEYHRTLDLDRKLEITVALTEEILGPVGGPWRSNEVIFHYNDLNSELYEQEKQAVLDLVF